MQELRFQIQGSAADPYEVRIVRRDDGNVSAYCTCPAGENGQHCKHRVGILTGQPVGMIGGNGADVVTVVSWVRGSHIGSVLGEFQAAEEEFEVIKAKVARLKKALAQAMLD